MGRDPHTRVVPEYIPSFQLSCKSIPHRFEGTWETWTDSSKLPGTLSDLNERELMLRILNAIAIKNQPPACVNHVKANAHLGCSG